MQNNNVTYFDSFGVEHIPKETRTFISNIKTNIFRIQAYDSIMCGYFYIKNKVSSTNNGRAMILSKCAIFDCKKPRFIKNQEAKGLLSNLGIKTTLSKVPILGDILF